jgi:hypothetical protein
MKRLLLLLGAAALLVAAPAFAQYVYLDSNGDGVCTTSDVLTDASTFVDVWMVTNANRDGSTATCSAPLTMLSYEFILSSNGNVTYTGYTNALAGLFDTPFGAASGGNDYRNGFGGIAPLAAGARKVGRVAITVNPGTFPVISPAASTTLNAGYFTAFGSECPGLEFDNTIKLGSDFMDLCGTTPFGIAVKATTWGAIKNIYR